MKRVSCELDRPDAIQAPHRNRYWHTKRSEPDFEEGEMRGKGK